MKKLTLLICALALFAGQLFAGIVSPAEAHRLALDFAMENGLSVSQEPSLAPIRRAGAASDCASEPLYIINLGDDHGWVVVAGDDRAASTVLGYSDHGSFDYETAPEALRWWLSEYEAQILSLSQANVSLDAARHAPQVENINSEVKPLLKDTWNQRSPFNDNCPTIDSKRCLAGCVAIAWGMVAHYNKWPASAQGNYSYIWIKNGEFLRTGSFNSTYNWSNILSSYSSDATATQKAEVAKLIADIANSVHMDFGLESSGANTTFATGVMASTFSFDPAMKVRIRKYYDDDDWDNILREELSAGRLVVYSGHKSAQDGGGGHCFVCDGYNDNGMFHFNYGWGSIDGAYFVTTALRDNYNESQSIATGVQKPQPGSVTGMDGTMNSDFTATYSSGKWTFSYTASPHISNHSVCTTNTAVCIENMVTGAKVYTATKDLTSSTGSGDWKFTTPSGSWTYSTSLASGTYKAYPVYKNKEASTWTRFYSKKQFQPNVKMTVSTLSKKVDGCMIENIFFAKPNMRLNAGDTLTIRPTVLPMQATNQTLTYTSSNTGVATVVSTTGKVTAKNPGTTTITATTKDGSGISATYTITVIAMPAGSVFSVGDFTYELLNPQTAEVAVTGLTEQGLTKTTIAFPKTVTYGSITFSVIAIADRALFDNQTVTTLTIPASIRTLGAYAFGQCYKVSTINYQAVDVENLIASNMTFYKTGRETSGITLHIAESVRRLPDNLFAPSTVKGHIPKIKTVDWQGEPQCTYIGSSAFYCDTALHYMTIPASVGEIGALAFSKCTSLDTLSLYPQTPPAAAADLFKDAAVATMVIEVECKSVWKTYCQAEPAGLWSQFSHVVFRGDCGIYDPYIVEDSAAICLGDEYLWADTTLTTSGIYRHVFKATDDEDSIVTLTLNVLEPTYYTMSEEIVCLGDSFLFIDHYIYPEETATYTDTLVNVAGCDSIVSIDIMVITCTTPTGVMPTSLSSDSSPIAYYTPQGLLIGSDFATLPRGIYIVRRRDNTFNIIVK